ncbi:MAG: hypothetical protein NUV59_03765, partial [Patescibacteria group bacterium]|nr:hypothetical protein [Patescibacteria group bacterium]
MPRFETIDAVSRWILIGLMAFLPFLFVPIQWIDVVSIKVVAVSLALVVVVILWMVARIMESAARIPKSIGIAAALALPIAYALSVAVTGGREVSLLGRGVEADTLAFVCLEFSAIALMALLFSGRVREILLSIYAFILGGAILALIEIMHFLIPSLSLGGVLTGQTGNVFGSWHAFAMMMGLVLLLAVGFAGAPFVRGWWRIILYSLAVLTTALLIVSSFTDVWVGVFLGMLALPALRAWQSRHFSLSSLWHKERIPLMVAAIALVFVIFGGSIQSVLPSRIQVTHIEVRPSWSGTLSIARQSLATPRDMLFGTGPNTFTRQWGLHKPSGVNQTPFWNNDFRVGVAPIPTSLITVGAIGLLAWVFFALAILWLALSLIRLRLQPAAAFIAINLSVALLYLLGMQVFSMPGPVLSMLLFLFAGTLIAVRAPRYDQGIRVSLALSDWRGRGSVALSVVAVVF